MSHAQGIKTGARPGAFLIDKSQRRRYYGTLVTHFYAPQLRRRRMIGRLKPVPREIA